MLLDLGFFAKILNVNENLGEALNVIFEEEEQSRGKELDVEGRPGQAPLAQFPNTSSLNRGRDKDTETDPVRKRQDSILPGKLNPATLIGFDDVGHVAILPLLGSYTKRKP